MAGRGLREPTRQYQDVEGLDGHRVTDRHGVAFALSTPGGPEASFHVRHETCSNLGFMMMRFSVLRHALRALVVGTVVLAMTAATARSAAAQVEVPSRLVHLRIRALEEGTRVRIFSLRADGSSPFLCATPCSEQLAPGALLRMILGEDQQYIQTYVVPNSPGEVVDVTVRLVDVVRPAPRGYLVGGIVALSVDAT